MEKFKQQTKHNKKAWITPELIMESVEETKGKMFYNGTEFTGGFGTTFGPS